MQLELYLPCIEGQVIMAPELLFLSRRERLFYFREWFSEEALEGG
jgi:hypothetical protein